MAGIFSITSHTNPEEFNKLVKIAAEALLSGSIIVMPSDTIYGLFSCFQSAQIDRLHKIKNRPKEIPFLFVFPPDYPLDDFADLEKLNKEGRERLEQLWPGANTVILNKNRNITYPLGETIAIRKPAKVSNKFFYETLRTCNQPLLAPSLNRHGDEPLVELNEIIINFGNEVDYIFFDENFAPGKPSNIWDLTKTRVPRLR